MVLVTGASGYVASHVVHNLLKAGYRVRGTVRSLKNAAKVRGKGTRWVIFDLSNLGVSSALTDEVNGSGEE